MKMLCITILAICTFTICGCGRQDEPSSPQSQPVTVTELGPTERTDDLVGYWMGNSSGGRGVWHFRHLEGNQVSVLSSYDEDTIRGTLLIENKTEPKRFSILVEEAGRNNAIGKTVRGIYKQEYVHVQGLDEKVMSMKVAISMPDRPFPSSFEENIDVRVIDVLKQP